MMSLAFGLGLCFGNLVDEAYLHRRPGALDSLYHVATTRRDSLLVLYRLYPLTESRMLLENLPEQLEAGSAAELAILSALWAFRTEGAGPFKMISYGRRSISLLEAAIAADPDDPFVLLAEGQSLFYRPEWFGGNKRAALQRFERLREVAVDASCAISALEADMWTWLALSELRGPQAEAVRLDILARQPPQLVRQFLDRSK